MSNERKLIDYINEFYKEIETNNPLTNEQKMIFETGVAKGITFVFTKLIDLNIDLSILGQYSEDNT